MRDENDDCIHPVAGAEMWHRSEVAIAWFILYSLASFKQHKSILQSTAWVARMSSTAKAAKQLFHLCSFLDPPGGAAKCELDCWSFLELPRKRHKL